MDNIVVQRPEFVREVETSAYGVVEKPLTTGEKIFNNAAVRKGILLVLLAVIWQVYATMLANPLLFPKFSETFAAFYENIMNGVLLQRGWFSIKVLLMGYVAGKTPEYFAWHKRRSARLLYRGRTKFLIDLGP